MKNLLFSIFVIVLFATCGTNKKSQPENIYKNDLFNFQLTIPSDWVITGEDAMAQITQMGIDQMQDAHDKIESALEAQEILSAQLLTISKYPLDQDEEDNPTLIIMAERIDSTAGFYSGRDVLADLKRQLEDAPVEVAFGKKVSEFDFADKTFYSIETNMKIGDSNISQQYYSTIENGFTLNMVSSYQSKTGRTEIDEILKTMKTK